MTMDEPIPCPQCGAPARITERFRLASIAGPARPHAGGHPARARLSPS